jgi:hypothetical protein
MQRLWQYLKNALIQFRKSLKGSPLLRRTLESL